MTIAKRISFAAPREEINQITRIVDRAEKLYQRLGYPFDRMSVHMDVTAVHCNGCPLRLKDFADADEINFAHDLGGIVRHLDRTTGQLTDCFLPRFADTVKMREPDTFDYDKFRRDEKAVGEGLDSQALGTYRRAKGEL